MDEKYKINRLLAHVSRLFRAAASDICTYVTHSNYRLINPRPANVENMVSSYQCQQMADGI